MSEPIDQAPEPTEPPVNPPIPPGKATFQKLVPKPAVDITDQFQDLNDEDTIYLTAAALKVKIKCLYDQQNSEPGNEIVHLTGSIVGDDGKAVKLANGKHAIFQLYRRHHQLSQRDMSPEEIEEHLENARLLCVQDTENAWFNYNHMSKPRRGITSIKAFSDRKAGEAGLI